VGFDTPAASVGPGATEGAGTYTIFVGTGAVVVGTVVVVEVTAGAGTYTILTGTGAVVVGTAVVVEVTAGAGT